MAEILTPSQYDGDCFASPFALRIEHLELIKATPNGMGAADEDEPPMVGRFVGLAAAGGLDYQNDDINQKGLKWDLFKSDGWFNYEHKQGPAHVIAFPAKDCDCISMAKDANGNDATRVIGDMLLAKPLARETWETMVALQKAHSERQLGFSIEGIRVTRDSTDPRIVRHATVRNIAITACPIRTTARVETVFCKSFAALEGYLVKGDDSGVISIGNQPAPGNDPSASLSALLRQSIDGPVVLRHSEPWTVGMVEQELLKAFPHLRKTGNLRKAAEQVRFLQALRMNGHPLT